jgi:hypothetical protein
VATAVQAPRRGPTHNAMTPIESGGKTRWVKIGRAWADARKTCIILDAMPFRSEYIYLYPVDSGPRDEDGPDADTQVES